MFSLMLTEEQARRLGHQFQEMRGWLTVLRTRSRRGGRELDAVDAANLHRASVLLDRMEELLERSSLEGEM